MIDKLRYDDTCKGFRKRAIRRKNNYIKAKKFKDDMINIFGRDYWINQLIGRFVKNTSINETPGYKGYYKTKNKGANHNRTYASTQNYKHSDLKKIARMDWDQAYYDQFYD